MPQQKPCRVCGQPVARPLRFPLRPYRKTPRDGRVVEVAWVHAGDCSPKRAA